MIKLRSGLIRAVGLACGIGLATTLLAACVSSSPSSPALPATPTPTEATPAASSPAMPSTATSSEGDTSVAPLGPLDEAGLSALKADSTATALDLLDRFAGQDGVTVKSATGQWRSCDDARSDFGEYTVNALISVPAGEPESQLEPFIAAMQADGWAARRDSLEIRQSQTQAQSNINGVVTFHKGTLGLQVVTTGGTDGAVIFSGACANSPAFNQNNGFNFADSDTIAVN